MGILDRLLRLEKARTKTFIDNDKDGFYSALLGEAIDDYKPEYYGPAGWDLYGVLNVIAAEVWDDG